MIDSKSSSASGTPSKSFLSLPSFNPSYERMYSINSLTNAIPFSMKKYTVFLISLTIFFLFADQNLLAPNLSSIADEFGFDDHERDQKLGGYIAMGFFIVGAPIALIVGYLTDMMNRCYLFGLVVLLGSTSSLSTYWVKSYEELFVCRIFTGISIGGINPVIFSMIGDLYPGESRIHVSTVIGIAQSAGIAAGQFLAGMVGPSLGWRAPFIMIAVPTIICALLAFFTVKEPKRGDQEKAVQHFRENQNKAADDIYSYQNKENNIPSDLEAEKPSDNTYTIATKDAVVEDEEPLPMADDIHYSEKIECSKVLRLFQTGSAVIIFIQGFPGCLPWGMIYVFLNDYFSSDRGMSVEAATGVLTCFGVGGLLGQLFGGWLGQRLYNKDPRLQTILMGISTVVSIGPMLYLLNTPTPGDAFFYIIGFLGGFVVNINGPNVRVVLQNVCTPEVRGTAFAFFTLADDVGKGLGPALVVLFIQAFNGNRREAFNTIVLFWVFCGCMLLLLVFTVLHDENVVQNSIKEALMKNSSLKAGSAPPSVEYNPINSPELRSQTAYVRMIDDYKPSPSPLLGISEKAEAAQP